MIQPRTHEQVQFGQPSFTFYVEDYKPSLLSLNVIAITNTPKRKKAWKKICKTKKTCHKLCLFFYYTLIHTIIKIILPNNELIFSVTKSNMRMFSWAKEVLPEEGGEKPRHRTLRSGKRDTI